MISPKMTNNNDINIPRLFTCPISLELFKDPVILSTGQTYDRSSIEKWLAMGNLTCPVTMQKLDHDPSLVPNHTLRHLIHQWLQIGPNPHHQTLPHHDHYISTIDSLAALKNQLQSHDQLSLPNKLQVLERVRILSQESPSGNSYLLQLGFLPLLLELVFEKIEARCSREYLDFVDQALYFVVKIIPVGGVECLSMLKEDRKQSIFWDLLGHGVETIKINLCRLIESISSSLHTKDVCAIFGNASKIVHRIIILLQQNSEVSNAGTRAIWSLCSLESNIENLVKEGAVNGLVTYMSSSEESRRGKRLGWIAMEAIEKLVGVESGKERLINDPKGLSAVVKMVFKVSDYDHEGSESAVSALIIVCCGSKRAREEAIREGVLSQLLLLLQSQCSTRTKTKGRMLLKLLRSKWVEDMKINHVKAVIK